MAGESGPILPSLPIAMTIAGLFGASCYICIEIYVRIVYTFERHVGLYFWSMIVATTGIVVYVIANLLRLFALAPSFPMSVLLVVGWWGMVTGQSVVLYSRLHLVVRNRRKVRWVLIMIITNVFILHIPVSVVFIGVNLDPTRFLLVFNIYERIQLVGFSLQEAIISSLYIWEAGHGLKLTLSIRGRGREHITQQLVIINTLVIFLDISVIITMYAGHFIIQTSYQPLIYAMKLQMEFIILNKLIAVMQQPQNTRLYPLPEPGLESLTSRDGRAWSGSGEVDHPAESGKSSEVRRERDANSTVLETNIGRSCLATGSAQPSQPPSIHYGL